MILEHATWFLFAWVFSNQAGVPVPVIPALIAAGALAGNGHLSLAVVVALAVGASLTADLTWYALGRWRGPRALKSLGRLVPGAGILIHRAQHAFSAHLGAFQLGARFLPELNPIASGLAGTARTSIIRFLCYGAAGALTWAGGWIWLGFLLSHAVTETAVHLGVRLIVLFLGAFALYLPFRRARRHRLIRLLRQAPVGSDQFSARRWIGDWSGTVDVPATQGSGVSTLTIRGGRS